MNNEIVSHPAPPDWLMTVLQRSTLADFAGLELEVVRDCRFACVAKIATPAHDIVVPLFRETALKELTEREGIAGVIAIPELADHIPDGMGLAVSREPMVVVDKIHRILASDNQRLRKSFETRIDPTARIDPGAVVAPRDVVVEAECEILAGAIVHSGTHVGRGTRIHSNAVIGADAYEVVVINGQQRLRPQTGGTAIGKNCEILSGTIVTRAAFCGATTIGNNVVLDCNSTVSHDCRISDNARVGGNSWLGGRVTIGEGASIGPNVAVANGVAVGQRAKVSIGSVVTRDVKADRQVSGNFAISHDRFLANLRKIR